MEHSVGPGSPDYLRLENMSNDVNHLPLETTKRLLYQVLEGLVHCHSQGVMHRNIKNANIMVTKDHQVKICDFALSKLTSIPHKVYTPEDPKIRVLSGRELRRLWYKPPELLFRKSHYAFECDMWAVGCLFWEIVMGDSLFDCECEIEMLFSIFKLTGSPSEEV